MTPAPLDPLTPTILLLHEFSSSSGTGDFALDTAASEITQLSTTSSATQHKAIDAAQQNRGFSEWATRCRVKPLLWWGKGVESPAL
jgi:hypothetical protein